jgi:serine/threonine protein kinase
MKEKEKEKINEEYELTIWKNGKNVDSCFKIIMTKNINTIQKLKDLILFSKQSITVPPEKIRLFSHKGMILEDLDIPYLKDSPLIYICFDNKDFNNINYYYEYKIIKPIKSGGFAQIFLGENVLTHEKVAIKKTDIKHFSTEEIYNLSREGRLISNLVHPNIIKIYCFYTYENYLYNVMEYAKGGELTQLINSKDPIPEPKIKNIFRQIYNAVQYIHNKNVIHRDLKTNNIVFLDEEKTHIAIIDFGISSISCGGDVLKAGTLKYIPPELLNQDTFKNSTKIDMWALGIILYLLYFKTFPFDGKTFSEIKKRIYYDPVFYPKNAKIRKTLMNLIEKLLEKDYNERISCGDESFNEYFNDENMSNDAFYNNRNTKAKSTKRLRKNNSALKINDVKLLLEGIKKSNKK